MCDFYQLYVVCSELVTFLLIVVVGSWIDELCWFVLLSCFVFWMFFASIDFTCFVVVFFFFKQKTAYEMRISDWSSDVCSSDLTVHSRARRSVVVGYVRGGFGRQEARAQYAACESRRQAGAENGIRVGIIRRRIPRRRGYGAEVYGDYGRSEERRVGKECGSKGRSRWSPSH